MARTWAPGDLASDNYEMRVHKLAGLDRWIENRDVTARRRHDPRTACGRVVRDSWNPETPASFRRMCPMCFPSESASAR